MKKVSAILLLILVSTISCCFVQGAQPLELTETYKEHNVSFRYPKGMHLEEYPFVPGVGILASGGCILVGYVDYHIMFIIWSKFPKVDAAALAEKIEGLLEIIRKTTGLNITTQGMVKDATVKGHIVKYIDAAGSYKGITGSGAFGIWYCDDSSRLFGLGAFKEQDGLTMFQNYLGTFDCNVPCIIATATYGSELSTEVQCLRGFREQVVLSTFAGSQFMHMFNAWYYSFSPAVAGFIAEQPVIKTGMKIFLYPLIGILRISTTIDTILNFNSEISVILIGIMTSALIGVVYFAPMTAIPLYALKVKRRSLPRMNILKPFLASWVISLILIVLGEITVSPLLMMIGTASLVIFTIGLTAITVALTVTRKLLK